MAEVSCNGRSTREINAEIKRLLREGEAHVEVKDSGARHNLGVAILTPGKITFDGSVGYYCAGLIDGPTVEIGGSAGWGLAESMMNGEVVVHRNAGNSLGAAIRGGTVVVYGDSGARTGVSMKGGLILVAGSCGYMAGFMGQKGTLIVCGDAGEAFADSMYETVCYVGGKITDLGNDTLVEEPSTEEAEFLDSTLARYLPASIRRDKPRGRQFKKVVSGRKLWNFDKSEWQVWQEAL